MGDHPAFYPAAVLFFLRGGKKDPKRKKIMTNFWQCARINCAGSCSARNGVSGSVSVAFGKRVILLSGPDRDR